MNYAPDIFFPSREGPTSSPARAKRICAACPVRDECLAANIDEPYGVFGGLSENQRRKIRRARNAKAVQGGGLPVPGDEAAPEVRMARPGPGADHPAG